MRLSVIDSQLPTAMKSVSVPLIPAIVGRPIQQPDDTCHEQAEF
ncbi:hypothetical protein ymoll0001_28880 [Yersinia mollaretii ATCC 43969]|uniref:Uncharacterized protein n=1 Tax=Yersinia mollaretii (strain ATCC 43969 / DSM 18520 / CIP 103324 / CNY 7263 / WAIP 204) TaxID=349967 RepID=A0ABM9YBC7_YERMW|nr:hypothetical protein ymoll0001_28880 [Yersinia mollaretii ATCC 43969]